MSDEDWEKWAAERLGNNGFNDKNRTELGNVSFILGAAIVAVLMLAVLSLDEAIWQHSLSVFGVRFRLGEKLMASLVIGSLLAAAVFAVWEYHTHIVRIPRKHVGIPYWGPPDDPQWESTRIRLTQGSSLIPRDLSIRIVPLNKPAPLVPTEAPPPSKVQERAERLREHAALEELELAARKEATRRRRQHLRDLTEDRLAEKAEKITETLKRGGVAMPDEVERKLLQVRDGVSVYAVLEEAKLEIEPGIARALANEVDQCERAIEKYWEDIP